MEGVVDPHLIVDEIFSLNIANHGTGLLIL